MFERIRTINGHKYLYEETRWREGGRVRSHSKYIRKLDKTPQEQHDAAMEKATKAADRAIAIIEKEQRAKFGKTVEEMRYEEQNGKKEGPTEAGPSLGGTSTPAA